MNCRSIDVPVLLSHEGDFWQTAVPPAPPVRSVVKRRRTTTRRVNANPSLSRKDPVVACINRVVLVGNLTRDPETRQAGATRVCSLRIAVNDRVKNRDTGAWKDEANYFTVRSSVPGRTLRPVPGQRPPGGNRRSACAGEAGRPRTAASAKPSRWSPTACSSSVRARAQQRARRQPRGRTTRRPTPTTTSPSKAKRKDPAMSRTPTTPWRSRITGSGTLKVAEAKPHELNFRLHPAAQSQALAASLDNVGWVQQVVVNTHHRPPDRRPPARRAGRAARQAELPCVYVELSEDEERLILASLDPIAAMASADREKLQELLASIQSEDEAVRGLLESIARQERIELPAAGGLVDPDEVPEPPDEPVTRPGDLWLLGDHRLLCGDSTKPEDVRRLMAGERASADGHRPALPGRLPGRRPPARLRPTGRPLGRAKTSTGTPTSTTSTRWPSTSSSCACAVECALTDDAAVYQCFGIMRTEVIWQAWREAACCPTRC